VAFFALLTTALPALLGQPRFLPVVQTVSLTVFAALALRHRNLAGALQVMALWLMIQFAAMTLAARFFGGQVEAAINDGFTYRGAIAAWFFGAGPLPGSLSVEPVRRGVEVMLVTLGSLVSAGLLGIWVIVNVLNRAAFGVGVLLSALESGGNALFTLPVWTLLRVTGYAGATALFAEPLLISAWSARRLWDERRGLLLVSGALILAGLALEPLLADLFARPPVL
jgi:hypothetical protein